MRAHIVDGEGHIINTAMVEKIEPGMYDADFIGGGQGDSIVNGVLVPRARLQPTIADQNAPILAALELLDTKSIRPLREGDSARVAAFELQAAALRAQLRKA